MYQSYGKNSRRYFQNVNRENDGLYPSYGVNRHLYSWKPSGRKIKTISVKFG